MKHFPLYWSICWIALSLLSGCCHRHSRSGPPQEKALELTLRMPSASMPDYVRESKGDAGSDALTLRAVVEARRSASGERAMRSVFNPAGNPDGSYTVSFALPDGVYDLYVWTDYAESSRPTADNFYNTTDLRSVAVMTGPYRSPTAGKDGACAVVSALKHESAAGTSKNVYLRRPFAAYRIVATDLAHYNALRLTHPETCPDLGELTFEVCYEYFFPTSFNLASSGPNDSDSGIKFSCRPDITDPVMVRIAGDVIFADDSDTFVSLTLVVRDAGGREIRRYPGVRVDYRRGFLTTVSGNFLTGGLESGGVEINTGWDEDITIRF